MFTGLIRNLATIDSVDHGVAGARIRLRPVQTDTPFERGESVAINGVCLTALQEPQGTFVADVSPETLSLTTLGGLKQGDTVNIERAMTAHERLGGHIVQGHVDAVGTLVSKKADGEFAVYRWEYPKEFDALLASKGSIAVDGVSLTIVEPDATTFGAALIPETLERTNLGVANVGDRVNLEFDIIAKLVQRMLAPYIEKLRS